MILPDGTRAEVIQLENLAGVIRATIQIVSPAAQETIAWLEVRPELLVTCGELGSPVDIAAAKGTG